MRYQLLRLLPAAGECARGQIHASLLATTSTRGGEWMYSNSTNRATTCALLAA